MLLNSDTLKQTLGMSVIPGITRLTPPWIGNSAAIRGGMGFGLGSVFGVDFTTNADGSPILDAYGNQVTDASVIADMVTKGLAILNSQQVFQLNLDRLQKGLQPIPTSYAAPTMNFGLAGVSMPMLLIGGALLLYLIASKKK